MLKHDSMKYWYTGIHYPCFVQLLASESTVTLWNQSMDSISRKDEVEMVVGVSVLNSLQGFDTVIWEWQPARKRPCPIIHRRSRLWDAAQPRAAPEKLSVRYFVCRILTALVVCGRSRNTRVSWLS